MKEKQGDNLSAILEYDFDYEKYIAERLREIDDLEERKFAKEILLNGLYHIIHCTEEKYKALEKRIYEEITIPENQYEVVSIVIQKKHYEPTNGTLFPITVEDFQEQIIREQFLAGNEIYLGSIYLEADCSQCRQFENKKYFSGEILSDILQESVGFYVLPSKRYRDTMEQLYQIFQDNHIPWETVNATYFDKFYDVFLKVEEEAGVKNSEINGLTLSDVVINFGEYEQAVCMERIPLWNIEYISFASTNFMVPCVDGIYYEHEFSIEDENRTDGYLILSNQDILEIRHEAKKIVLKSQKETFEGWTALRIVQDQTVRSLDYEAPFLSNHKKDTFFRRYAEESKVSLLTKTDLFRRIMELDIGDFIEVVDYDIKEHAKDYPVTEGMNWFSQDELFPLESRKVLLLKFREKTPGCYLNDSMVRFVISQMQMEIGEYRCVGVIL